MKKISKKVSKNVSKKVSRKVLTILLLLCTLIFVGVLTSVYAAEGDTGTPEGTGIGSAADFVDMQPGGTYYLTKNIVIGAGQTYTKNFTGTLDGKGFTITTSVPLFKELNGTVKNLNIGPSDKSKTIAVADANGAYCGCLACSAATKANTVIENVNNYTSIEIATNSTETPSTNVKAIAGLVGLGGVAFDKDTDPVCATTLTITNCHNYGVVNGGGDSGGIIAVSAFTPDGTTRLILSGCENHASVTAKGRPGGVCGIIAASAEISGCKNEGVIESSGNYSGGVCGRACGLETETAQTNIAVTFTQCVNMKKGTVRSWQNEGGGICGYIGHLNQISFIGCTNEGTVTFTPFPTNRKPSTNENEPLKYDLGGISGRVATTQIADTTRKIKFENCVNKGDVGCVNAGDHPGNYCLVSAGGISATLTLKEKQSGNMNVSFTGCRNEGGIYGRGTYTKSDDKAMGAESGGIVIAIQAYPGQIDDVTIRDCENTGYVLGHRPGGIVGRLESAARVINCVNDGKIESPTNYPGGICARINGAGGNGGHKNDCTQSDEFLFLRCVNRGEVSVFKSEGGGIVGYGCNLKGVSFRDCCNFGYIHSPDATKASLGGISGIIESQAFGTGKKYDQYERYIDCTNYGKIEAKKSGSNVGGISGQNKAQVMNEYIRCGNTGKLTSGGYCGGITGYKYAKDTYGPRVYCCFNRGDIEGNGFVSGLIAYMNCGYVPDVSHNYVAGTLTNNKAATTLPSTGQVAAKNVYKTASNKYFIGPAGGKAEVKDTYVLFTPGTFAKDENDVLVFTAGDAAFSITDEMSVGGTPLNRNVYKFTSGGNDYLFVNPLLDAAQAKVTAFSTDGDPYVEIEATALKDVFPGKIKIRAFDASNFTIANNKCTKFKVPLFDSPIKTSALFWSNNNNFMFDEKSNIVKEEIASIDYTMGFFNKFCAVGGTTNDATTGHVEADFTDGTVLNALNKGIEKAFYQNPYTDTASEKYPTTDKMHILPDIGASGKVIWKYGDKTLYEQAITEGADYRYMSYGPGDTKVFDHWEKSTSGSDVIFTAKDGIECEMQTVLGSEIVVKLRMGLPAYMCEDETAKMSFTIGTAPEGEEPTAQELTLASAEREDGKYVFGTCEVPAKEMSDEIPVHVEFTAKKDWIGDEVIDPIKYDYTPSVRQYAGVIIGSTETEQKFKDAAVAMLNYGAAAQTYFGYNTKTPENTSNLANAGLTDAQKGLPEAVTENPFVGHDMTVTPSEGFTGITFNGAALNLKSKTGIRYFFTLDQPGEGETNDIGSYSFSYKRDGDTAAGTSVTADERGEQWMVEIPGINASALSDEYVLTVTKGGQSMTIKYGPFAYFNRMWNKEAASVAGRAEIPLGKAFWLYHQKANALL